MKNIHLVLAGESRLSLNRSYRDYAIGTEVSKPYWIYSQYKHHMSVTDASVRPHNMYITNDEEIKEGDWYLTNKNTLCKCIKTDSKYVYSLNGGSSTNCKKIILTTDQALIKDGVWGIEDGFLEWFVKNPTCEYVELKGYAIILPGESCDCDKMCDECKEEVVDGLTMGQIPANEETHEYDLLQHIKFCLECKNESQAIRLIEKYGFVKQEQDKNKYSEIEVLDLLVGILDANKCFVTFIDIKEWFEQNKKK
jgi:hypothetical protein